MKKFTKVFDKINGGGVLVLSAFLALSLIFASCANSSDSDDGNNTSITDTGNNNSNNSNNSNSGDNDSNNSNSNGNSNNSNSSSNGNNSSNSNSNNSNVNSGNNNNDANNNNSNGGNNNNDNPSPTLPESVGENPITETVKLYYGDNSDRYLELKSDKTARYIDAHNDEEEIEVEFEYSYDENKNEIYMRVKKYFYNSPFTNEEGKLLTYNEILSKINEETTVENVREYLMELYENAKNEKYFKEKFPDCNSYKEFEEKFLEKSEFASFDDYVKQSKQRYEDMHKAVFNAQTTYAYDIEDGKITLVEKFTGVKNMFMESLFYYENGESSYGGVHNILAFIMEDDVYYTGIPNTEKNTISFLPDGGGKKVTATYAEDIAKKKVTISFNGKDYVCEFYGRTFTQE